MPYFQLGVPCRMVHRAKRETDITLTKDMAKVFAVNTSLCHLKSVNFFAECNNYM